VARVGFLPDALPVRTPRFELFGAAHLGALVLTAVAAALLTRAVRGRPADAPAPLAARAAIAAVLLAATVGYLVASARDGQLSVWDFVPLHLCDFLIFVALFALASLHPLACEALFFTACTGTVLAMVTPDLGEGFPDFRFLAYFVCHGAVVVAAMVLTLGLGIRPRPGAPLRVLGLVNAYAAVVAVVNVAYGANFLYLRAPPRGRTILDWFGPWPVYILVVEAIALVLFAALDRLVRRVR
jgi:hypothetical integral membrane protein (TIGR02206 family)